METTKIICTFCDKKSHEVEMLIAAPSVVKKIALSDGNTSVNIASHIDVYICDECVDRCNEIIAKKTAEKQSRSSTIPSIINW